MRTKAPFAAGVGSAVNERGIFPMLGNIWEWCLVEWDKYAWDKVPTNLAAWEYPGEIRGGSFLEALEETSDAKMEFDQFPGGIKSRDKDTGFRIASDVALAMLPDHIREYFPVQKKTQNTRKAPAKKTPVRKATKRWRPKMKK
jgi:hypothetical protein